MGYEERLTCFIDLLGFKSAIDQSLDDDSIYENLYKVIHQLKTFEIKKGIYGSMPPSYLNGIWPSTDKELVDKLSDKFPISITQFSDSYVLSCPKDNPISCLLLLRCTCIIHWLYYHNLGMMMRGGITLGKLTHEEGGALFGPAMNEAYEIESKISIYPRVVISEAAFNHIHSTLVATKDIEIFKTSFDGYKVIDLISMLSITGETHREQDEIDKRLEDIRKKILLNHPKSHSKIAYLISEWGKLKKHTNQTTGTPIR